MSLPIVPVGQNASRFWNLLLYAPPGTGKTRFVGTGKNVLIIRPPTDHTDSIRGAASRNIKEFVANGWSDMDLVFQHLDDEGDQYDIVALDSISLFQDQGLDDIWEQVLTEKPQRRRYGMDVQEYGINMHRLGLWVRGVVGLQKFNFIVTAHPFWGKNIDDEELLMPWVQGRNMPEKICGCMNMVGYMDVKKVKLKGESAGKRRRVIFFEATDRYYAKDQFDAFPGNKLVDPTIDKLEKGIKAARAREAATTTKATKKGRKATTKKGK